MEIYTEDQIQSSIDSIEMREQKLRKLLDSGAYFMSKVLRSKDRIPEGHAMDILQCLHISKIWTDEEYTDKIINGNDLDALEPQSKDGNPRWNIGGFGSIWTDLEVQGHIYRIGYHYRNGEDVLHAVLQGINPTQTRLHTGNIPVTNTEKVGRNEPCTCGSGKKYKKCCG